MQCHVSNWVSEWTLTLLQGCFIMQWKRMFALNDAFTLTKRATQSIRKQKGGMPQLKLSFVIIGLSLSLAIEFALEKWLECSTRDYILLTFCDHLTMTPDSDTWLWQLKRKCVCELCNKQHEDQDVHIIRSSWYIFFNVMQTFQAWKLRKHTKRSSSTETH